MIVRTEFIPFLRKYISVSTLRKEEKEQVEYLMSDEFDFIQGGNEESVCTNDDPMYLPAHIMAQSVISATDGTAGNTTRSGSRRGEISSFPRTSSFRSKSPSQPSLPMPLPSEVVSSSAVTTTSSLTGTKTTSTKSGKIKNIEGEMIIVNAPAGKLGIIIDTTDNGLPVIHSISDKCPIAGQIKLNDMLIAVDAKDVRNMTAAQVSKLIAEKSENKVRKFTILRRILSKIEEV